MNCAISGNTLEETIAMKDTTFDHDLIHAIFKHMWSKALERQKNESPDGMDCEVVIGASKKNRPTSAILHFANSNAIKLTCELLRVFVSEAVQRAAAIAEAEGVSKIEPTHLERILPQLLLDF